MRTVLCSRVRPVLDAHLVTERRHAILNVHSIMESSRANGPGVRIATWLQGCSLRCPGCFNPQTHSKAPRLLMRIEDLVETIKADREEIEGLTISGGEPLEQPDGLYRLMEGVRESTSLSVILFSGLEMEEIRALPQGPDILQRTDVLIAGRYVEALRLPRGLRGSSNQRIHLLSDRYRLRELEETPVAEVSVDGQGRITISGIDPPRLFGTDIG